MLYTNGHSSQISYFCTVTGWKWHLLCQGERGNFKQNLSHLCEFQRGLIEGGWKSGRRQRKPVEQGGEKDCDDEEFASGMK